MSDIEVLINRLNTSDQRHAETTQALREFKTILDGKVSYKHFTWILGILIIVLMAMFGWIAYQIGQINITASSTEKSVASIQGKLDPYNVEFKN